MLPFGLFSSTKLALLFTLSGKVKSRNYLIRGIWSAESLYFLYDPSAYIRITQVNGRAQKINTVRMMVECVIRDA